MSLEQARASPARSRSQVVTDIDLLRLLRDDVNGYRYMLIARAWARGKMFVDLRNEDVADALELSVRSIIRVKRRLEEAGFAIDERTHRHGGHAYSRVHLDRRRIASLRPQLKVVERQEGVTHASAPSKEIKTPTASEPTNRVQEAVGDHAVALEVAHAPPPATVALVDDRSDGALPAQRESKPPPAPPPRDVERVVDALRHRLASARGRPGSDEPAVVLDALERAERWVVSTASDRGERLSPFVVKAARAVVWRQLGLDQLRLDAVQKPSFEGRDEGQVSSASRHPDLGAP